MPFWSDNGVLFLGELIARASCRCLPRADWFLSQLEKVVETSVTTSPIRTRFILWTNTNPLIPKEECVSSLEKH